MLDVSGVILITGVMAAGKSTVAQLVAERLPRSVHVRGDVFRRFIVSGAVEPSPDMSAEADRQLLLRYRCALGAADTYVEAGFVAVVQDVMVGPVLADAVVMIRSRPRYLVVLDPEPVAVVDRERGRFKTGYSNGFQPAGFVAGHRGETPRLGLWLNSTHQTASETADAVLARLSEALLPEF